MVENPSSADESDDAGAAPRNDPAQGKQGRVADPMQDVLVRAVHDASLSVPMRRVVPASPSTIPLHLQIMYLHKP